MPPRQITIADRQRALVAVTLELEQVKKENAKLTALLDKAYAVISDLRYLVTKLSQEVSDGR